MGCTGHGKVGVELSRETKHPVPDILVLPLLTADGAPPLAASEKKPTNSPPRAVVWRHRRPGGVDQMRATPHGRAQVTYSRTGVRLGVNTVGGIPRVSLSKPVPQACRVYLTLQWVIRKRKKKTPGTSTFTSDPAWLLRFRHGGRTALESAHNVLTDSTSRATSLLDMDICCALSKMNPSRDATTKREHGGFMDFQLALWPGASPLAFSRRSARVRSLRCLAVHCTCVGSW